MDTTDRERFLQSYHIDASGIISHYNCIQCSRQVKIFNAVRHMQSMRHLKKCNKNKCYVNLTEFKVIDKLT